MKVEILFPDLCYLYGDKGNIRYLKECMKDAEFIETSLNEMPAFVNEDVSLIYMCSMTEKGQERAIERLLKYKERIQELINKGVCFLLTGNSFEIFNKYIEDENGRKIEGLGILNYYSKRYIPKRFNSLFLGEFEDFEIVGYTSRFSHTYGESDDNYLFKVTKGLGINEQSKYEGIRVNNLFASYLLGPLLIQNPKFTKYILNTIKSNEKLAFEKEIMNAYEIRLKELKIDFEFN